ncbi:MAG: HAD family hydrolase [Bacteroidales bacterium]|nr:HAD family hydrolase [Bacteroidales bacterium]MBR6932769.1 HAD family hydrolase [Bacteroidales bacterium]
MDRNRIRLVAIDADDTLWDCQSYFDSAIETFKQTLSPYAGEEELFDTLTRTELGNMEKLGFGGKAFTISMIETALAFGADREQIGRVLKAGRSVIDMPATPLPGVVETLQALRGHYYTVLYTKGDLQEQAGKIRRSGLAPLFDETVIVPHKDGGTYRDLCDSAGVATDEFAMVGNSFKSDIAPVLEIGGWGIYVPCDLSWAYEDIEEYDHPNLVRLASFRDLAPLLLG